MSIKDLLTKITQWIKAPIIKSASGTASTYIAESGSTRISFGVAANGYRGMWDSGLQKWIIDTDGTDIYIIGNKVADIVVDQGTSGIWTYRKWSSGIAECWGVATQSVTSWKTWGSDYYGDPYSSYNYPSGLFKSGTYPVVTANGGTTTGISNGDITSVAYGGSSSATGTNVKTPQMYVMRSTSGGTGSFKIFIHAIGQWK